MVTARVAAGLLGLLWASAVAAEDEPITVGQVHVVRSQVLGEDRRIWVYTPPGYEVQEVAGFPKRLPVLYVLDGRRLFLPTVGTALALAANAVPELIVVGVESTDRYRDFTPTRVKDRPGSGGADRFLLFLEAELFSYVDQSYRTQPIRILAGHSLGGLFVVHALLSRPEAFSGYLAASPILDWDDELPLRRARAMLWTPQVLRKTLFLGVGGDEEARLRRAFRRFESLLRERCPTGFEWAAVEIENEDHDLVSHRTFDLGLRKVFDGYRARPDVSVSKLKADYARLSERLGYTVTPGWMTVHKLGLARLRAGDYDAALDFCLLNFKLQPRRPQVLVELAQAFEAVGDLERARKCLEQAVTLSQQLGYPAFSVQSYRERNGWPHSRIGGTRRPRSRGRHPESGSLRGVTPLLLGIALLAAEGRPLFYWGARPPVLVALPGEAAAEAQVIELHAARDAAGLVLRFTLDRAARAAVYLPDGSPVSGRLRATLLIDSDADRRTGLAQGALDPATGADLRLEVGVLAMGADPEENRPASAIVTAVLFSLEATGRRRTLWRADDAANPDQVSAHGEWVEVRLPQAQSALAPEARLILLAGTRSLEGRLTP